MISGGYTGKFLKINLSEGKISKHSTPEYLMRNFLGGSGWASRILWDNIDERVEPFSEKNLLIFAVGPVTGTAFLPSGRYVVATRSPLTGWWAESHAGGSFGPELKYAGYDMIIIEGNSQDPVYLYIEDDFVELRKATHLWGKNVHETTDMICGELGDPDIKVACIGQAGENKVKYACIINDYYRAAGRTGIGAVMGSKKLKAVAVRGSKSVRVAEPEKFEEFFKEIFYRHKEGRWSKYIKESSRKYGTTGLIDGMNAIGRFPMKNHQLGYMQDVPEKIGCERIRKEYRVGENKSCFGCGIQCKYVSEIKSGKYAGTRSEGPEYEIFSSFGAGILDFDLNTIMRTNYLCNNYGIDYISAGSTISFAIEAYENGIITKADTDGMELKWGDGELAIKLLEKIVKREGFGDLLAEGSKEAARIIGKGAERFAIHVNGLEASGQDGRAHKSLGLTYAINVRGADHLRSLSIVDELGFRDIAQERFPQYPTDVVCDLLDEKYKGYLVADQEEIFAVCDSLIACKYGVMWPPIYYFQDYGKAISLKLE